MLAALEAAGSSGDAQGGDDSFHTALLTARGVSWLEVKPGESLGCWEPQSIPVCFQSERWSCAGVAVLVLLCGCAVLSGSFGWCLPWAKHPDSCCASQPLGSTTPHPAAGLWVRKWRNRPRCSPRMKEQREGGFAGGEHGSVPKTQPREGQPPFHHQQKPQGNPPAWKYPPLFGKDLTPFQAPGAP